jgi:hypothetical protein
MSISPGDVLKIVAVLSWLDGNVAQNVFGAAIGGTGGPYDDEDIGDDALAWVSAMFSNITTGLSNQIDGSEVKVYKYDSVDDDFDEVATESWTFNPSNSADQLPRGVAALINCKTMDPDVSGKKYIPGLTEGAVTAGLFESGTMTALANFADDWLGPFTGGTSGATWIPGVWSPTRTNFYAATGTALISTIPAYQRRRKRGVGI